MSGTPARRIDPLGETAGPVRARLEVQPAKREGRLRRLLSSLRSGCAALLRRSDPTAGPRPLEPSADPGRSHESPQPEPEESRLVLAERIGARFAGASSLTGVADLLIELILEELDFRGAEVSLLRVGDEPGFSDPSRGQSPSGPLLRRGGHCEGRPQASHLLETGSRPFGTLKVWIDAQADGAEGATMIGHLLPWIALALAHARAVQALDRHVAELQCRVKERTDRLLTANHHLTKEIERRRRTAEALVESETQRRASERLASIGTLAAGIAHEINNPIGSILAAAQLAQLDEIETGARSQVSNALEDIIEQARRCGGIIRSILQFARDEPTDKWDCRLEDLVSRSVRLAMSFARERRVELRVERLDREAWARINPIQIEQAIVHLIRNAIESGARAIGVELLHEPGRDRVRILVLDDGQGIGRDEQPRILDPFFTTKRSSGRAGLGLSVVHGIVAEHRGTLEIEPGAGGGTRATLTLPSVDRVEDGARRTGATEPGRA